MLNSNLMFSVFLFCVLLFETGACFAQVKKTAKEKSASSEQVLEVDYAILKINNVAFFYSDLVDFADLLLKFRCLHPDSLVFSFFSGNRDLYKSLLLAKKILSTNKIMPLSEVKKVLEISPMKEVTDAFILAKKLKIYLVPQSVVVSKELKLLLQESNEANNCKVKKSIEWEFLFDVLAHEEVYLKSRVVKDGQATFNTADLIDTISKQVIHEFF